MLFLPKLSLLRIVRADSKAGQAIKHTNVFLTQALVEHLDQVIPLHSRIAKQATDPLVCTCMPCDYQDDIASHILFGQ
jgi:hypothetical protein